MTNKTEAQIFADDRPSSLDDDLYQWSLDAEIMLRAQAYRIAQLEAELSEHKAARIAYANEFALNVDGEPDVGNIHANIRQMKAQLAQRQMPAELMGLLREARDNCQASIVESGISDQRREYRSDLHKRLDAMLAASPTPPARKGLSEVRKDALALYKPPFQLRHGYIFDSAGHMVADEGRTDEVEALVAARVRGWGRIGYMPNAAALQDEVGEVIVDALNQYWSAHGIQGEGN